MQRRTAHTDARIADNTVQPAIVGNRLVHQLFNGGRLAAIGLDKGGIPTLFTDTVCNGFALFHTAGSADNLHALGAIALGNRTANTAACTGDDDDFSLNAAKIHHFVSLLKIYACVSDNQPTVAYPVRWCYTTIVDAALQSAILGRFDAYPTHLGQSVV